MISAPCAAVPEFPAPTPVLTRGDWPYRIAAALAALLMLLTAAL